MVGGLFLFFLFFLVLPFQHLFQLVLVSARPVIHLICWGFSDEFTFDLSARFTNSIRLYCSDQDYLLRLSMNSMINSLLHRLPAPGCRCQICEWISTILVLLVSEDVLSGLIQFLSTEERPHRPLHLYRSIWKWQLASRRLLTTVFFLKTGLPLVLLLVLRLLIDVRAMDVVSESIVVSVLAYEHHTIIGSIILSR